MEGRFTLGRIGLDSIDGLADVRQELMLASRLQGESAPLPGSGP